MPTTNRIRSRRVSAALLTASLAGAITLVPRFAHAADAPTKVALTFDGASKKLSGFPTTLPGGITTLSVTSPAYLVTLQLAQVVGIHSDAVITKAINNQEGAPPKWLAFYGGTGLRGGAATTQTATVNLDKGKYIWVVFSNGDQLDGKAPWARFAVTGAKSAIEPSGGTATIKTLEYGFDVTGLKPGLNTVNYINGGKEWHHVIMEKLMPGKTMADVQKALGSNGPPPAGLFDEKANADLPVQSPGLTEVTEFELSKGTYVFACFMPDKTGKPHAMSGMVKEVVIA
jgi:plastocyanin